MAAAATYLNGTHTTTTGTKSTSGVPAVGDLTVIFAASSGLAGVMGTAPTDNNVDGLGAYTQVALAQSSANTELLACFIRNALVGNSASTTFTHAQGATTGGGLEVYSVSGMTKTGLTALLQKAEVSGGTSGTAPTTTFPAAAQAANVILAAVMANQATANAITPPTSYTEDAEHTYTTPSRVLEVVHRNGGETGTTLTWGSTTLAWGAIAVELDSSGATPPANDDGAFFQLFG
jgi:hypothetical protein